MFFLISYLKLFSKLTRDNRVSKLVENAVQMLLPERIIRTPGSPSTLVSSVLQNGKVKYVVHLLNYVPRRAGAPSTGILKE